MTFQMLITGNSLDRAQELSRPPTVGQLFFAGSLFSWLHLRTMALLGIIPTACRAKTDNLNRSSLKNSMVFALPGYATCSDFKSGKASTATIGQRTVGNRTAPKERRKRRSWSTKHQHCWNVVAGAV